MFEVEFTETAAADMERKADYITDDLGEPETAKAWYEQLYEDVKKYLSEFPEMYPVYPPEKAEEIRQAVFGKDVVLYSVDVQRKRVMVEMVCSNGQDIAARIKQR